MQKKILIIGVTLMICLGFFSGCTSIKGSFYSLQEAYDNGWLTQEDLQSLAYYYNVGSNDESFVPKPKNPESLSKETENMIIKTHLEGIKKDFPTATISDVNIAEYYGVYNDCIAISVRDNYYAIDVLVEPEYIVGGVSFYNFTLPGLQIWRDGKK